METSRGRLGELGAQTRDVARRLLDIGENRLELLKVEMQEERELLLRTILLAFAASLFAMLAAIALTAAIVVCFWASAPVTVLLTLTVVYGTAGALLVRKLTGLFKGRKSFSASFDQLRKDPGLFGREPGREPHESRKQFLIAESEFNRAQLARDLAALTTDVSTLTDRTRSFGSIASSAVDLVAGLPAFHRNAAAKSGTKTSWLPAVLKCAGIISSLWISRAAARRAPPTGSRAP